MWILSENRMWHDNNIQIKALKAQPLKAHNTHYFMHITGGEEGVLINKEGEGLGHYVKSTIQLIIL